jgi:hypothetical protein
MASKTVWIVGGVVVVIGAIAYLSYSKAPAGKDAAGTIVEAKRARSDGTNSFNPTPTASTTDQNASDASKAMAGPDAAKDAAAAAGGSGDNMRRALMDGSGRTVAHAPEAVDAAAAAGSGDNAKKGMDAKMMHLRTSDSADAAGAASGHSPSNLRGASSAATSQSAVQQQSNAESMKKE